VHFLAVSLCEAAHSAFEIIAPPTSTATTPPTNPIKACQPMEVATAAPDASMSPAPWAYLDRRGNACCSHLNRPLV
jgi:hypothetical protein